MQTAFAIAYAVGQMVNGAIVDRVDPVRHMLLGIAGSGVCNLLLGLSPGYAPMLLLCMLNGVFQSMLWTPILRMIAQHFAAQKSRETANTIIALVLVVGHLGAWALSGYLSGVLSWRYSFIAPALLVIPALLAGLLLFRGVDRGERISIGARAKAHPALSPRKLLSVFAASGFLVMLIACVMFGFVRDGIKTWTPAILGGLSNGDAVAATSFSLIIPPVNALGMFIAYRIQQQGRVNNRRMVALLLIVSAAFCLPMLFTRSMLLTALLLGCACACTAGLEPVLTGLVPIEYEQENLIGMTAGLIDSLVYVGSALSGVLAGLLYEGSGANTLFLCWAIAALVGAACSLIAGGMMRRYRNHHSINQTI